MPADDDRDDDGRLAAERFESYRPHLRAVAQRMLGPGGDADDAVQQAWLRYRRADTSGVTNLGGWLTTVVSRLCLDALRSRAARREEPLADLGDGAPAADTDPADEVELVAAIGPALLVVLDRLSPAERVAFVLHDLFAVPFDEVGPVVGRTPATAKKLASRARHRVRGGATAPAPVGPDRLAEERRVVDAFLAATRDGDLGTLMTVLAPDVVRVADRQAVRAGGQLVLRGAGAVADETKVYSSGARSAQVALVDGAPGIVVAPGGRLAVALRITVAGGKVTAIDVVADPARLAALDLAVPD
jgi:RNA polymerase sigma-70 factor (ECF subfamily)